MDIQINDDNMLTILKALYGEFVSTKMYFQNHKNNKELIGLISPDEYKELYNTLLKQAHEQQNLLELNLI